MKRHLTRRSYLLTTTSALVLGECLENDSRTNSPKVSDAWIGTSTSTLVVPEQSTTTVTPTPSPTQPGTTDDATTATADTATEAESVARVSDGLGVPTSTPLSKGPGESSLGSSRPTGDGSSDPDQVSNPKVTDTPADASNLVIGPDEPTTRGGAGGFDRVRWQDTGRLVLTEGAGVVLSGGDS